MENNKMIECVSENIHNIVNELTEYRNNYKLINLNLIKCYCILKGKKGIVCFHIFAKIIESKIYGELSKSKKGEECRIYNDLAMSLKQIVFDIFPGKYTEDSPKLKGECSNLLKILKTINDENIFYVWKFKNSIIFFMERNLGCWKPLNPKGNIAPKTLRKILRSRENIIEKMMKFEKELNKCIVEDSFVDFILGLFEKMGVKIDLKDKNKEDIFFLLENKIKDMRDYEFIEYDDVFLKNIPPDISEKIRQKSVFQKENSMSNKKDGVDSDNDSFVELIPDNPNIISTRKIKQKITSKSKGKNKNISRGTEPKSYRYSERLDPFSGKQSMYNYFCAFIERHFGKSVNFNSYIGEAQCSAEIIDLLQEDNNDNRVFLMAWLKYFCDEYLKGDKINKKKYTSLVEFKKTYNKFLSVYTVA